MFESKFKFNGIFTFANFYKENGVWKVRWFDKTQNLTVAEGLNDILNVYFHGGTQSSTWYVGLKGSSETVVDGFNSAGIGTQFTEFTDYAEANRVEWVEAAVSNKLVTNSASPAQFNITGLAVEPTNLYGGFLINQNSKEGTTGKLWCCSNLSVPRPVYNNDLIKCVYTLTSQDV